MRLLVTSSQHFIFAQLIYGLKTDEVDCDGALFVTSAHGQRDLHVACMKT